MPSADRPFARLAKARATTPRTCRSDDSVFSLNPIDPKKRPSKKKLNPKRALRICGLVCMVYDSTQGFWAVLAGFNVPETGAL